MVFGLSIGGGKSKSKYNEQQIMDVNAPAWWDTGVEDLNTGIDAFAKQYGYGNITPQQDAASNTLYGINQANYASDFLKKNVNPAIQAQAMGTASLIPNMNYSLTGTTPKVEGQGVTASTAFDMSAPYQKAYGTGVLDSALSDYDTGVARSANAFRAGSLTGAPNTGQSVAAGVLGGEAARGRGSLSASIRGDILDKSFGFGGADAGLKLNADTTTANNMQSASAQNAQLAQQDRLTNLDAQIKGDSQKMAAYDQAARLIQAQGDNALQSTSVEAQNAINALQAAGIPIDQALALIQAQIGGLDAAVPGFGTTTNSSGTSSGTNASFGFGQKGGK